MVFRLVDGNMQRFTNPEEEMTATATAKAKFDPAHSLSYGYYQCPSCGREWYDTHAFHTPGCEKYGMGGCIYMFGANENLDFAPRELHDYIKGILSREGDPIGR